MRLQVSRRQGRRIQVLGLKTRGHPKLTRSRIPKSLITCYLAIAEPAFHWGTFVNIVWLRVVSNVVKDDLNFIDLNPIEASKACLI